MAMKQAADYILGFQYKLRMFRITVEEPSYIYRDKKHLNTDMVFDPSEPEIDMSSFQRQDWSYSIYSLPGEELKEALPPNMLC